MAERFFSFLISEQEFAIDSDRIIEVVEDILITKIPLSKTYVSGVANFRGELVAVIDLAEFLGQKRDIRESEQKYLICTSSAGPTALLVSEIGDIMQPESITLAEEIDAEIDLPHFLGVITGKKGLIRILDVDSVLAEINKKHN